MSGDLASTPEPKAPVVPAPGTPASGGVPAGKPPEVTPPAATPAPGTPPVAPKSDEGNLRAQLQKSQDDLRKMKSAYDRKLGDYTRREQALQGREQGLTAELERTRTAGMTEDELKIYRAEHAQEEVVTLTEENQRLSVELQERAIRDDYLETAARFGLPKDVLVMDQGLTELAESVWGALFTTFSGMKTEVEQLRAGKPPTPAGAPPPTPPTGPPVAGNTGVPASGLDWKSLREKYGSDEAVYALIESGQLSSDILPKPST